MKEKQSKDDVLERRDKDLALCRLVDCEFEKFTLDKAIEKTHCDKRLIQITTFISCPRCFALEEVSKVDYCYECCKFAEIHFRWNIGNKFKLYIFDIVNFKDAHVDVKKEMKRLVEIIKDHRSKSNKY